MRAGPIIMTSFLASFLFGSSTSCGRERARETSTTAAEVPAEEAAPQAAPKTEPAAEPMPAPGAAEAFAAERRELLRIVQAYGVKDARVLAAIAKVPRHELVPEEMRALSYEDHPLPIGEDQTISQPSLVARMTELARVDQGDRVLEVGTGSGYQAAVLAELTDHVYSIEIVEPLARRAKRDLGRLGYGGRIHLRTGDGYAGWREAAPFDAIIVTAAPPEIPAPLRDQLAVGGRMVIPVGERVQDLRVIERTKDGFVEEPSIPVRFVPMTGRAQEKKRDRQ